MHDGVSKVLFLILLLNRMYFLDTLFCKRKKVHLTNTSNAAILWSVLAKVQVQQAQSANATKINILYKQSIALLVTTCHIIHVYTIFERKSYYIYIYTITFWVSFVGSPSISKYLSIVSTLSTFLSLLCLLGPPRRDSARSPAGWQTSQDMEGKM